jgi:hypothetical protein
VSAWPATRLHALDVLGRGDTALQQSDLVYKARHLRPAKLDRSEVLRLDGG